MPFVETRFISPTTLTTSASSALYTVPTGYSAIIKQLVVTNITGTAATFTFYIGAASAGNALFSGTSVAANDTVIINLSQVLTTGEILGALASTGSALNLTVSGVINDGPLASTATYIADNAITSAKIAPSPTISLPAINNIQLGYTTTATAGGTTTLTNTSNNQQVFTGSSNHLVVMPVASTMTVGTSFLIENNSTGNLNTAASGGNQIVLMDPGTTIKMTLILASGITQASWSYDFVGFNSITGTGSNVLSASPTLTGTPLALTAAAGTNTTQIATTAFVTTAVSNIRVGAVPNFLVYLSGGNGSAVGEATIAYNSEQYDDTNNVVNGVFTVPTGQAGIYSFTHAASAYSFGTSGFMKAHIVTTGTIANGFFGSSATASGGVDHFVSAALIIKLSVTDTVFCRWKLPASGTYSAGIAYNWFSGTRIA